MTIEMFPVGGCVRDEIMGKHSKDVDVAVVAPSFAAMVLFLMDQGFTIWQTRDEFVTVRAGVPKGHPFREIAKDADFVLCRKDGPSSDGRRPDRVEAGTLMDDLARRDFTCNAIAKHPMTGEFIDPFDGISDIRFRTLRFVGDPATRINEDGLRVVRGFRFMVTKGFTPTTDTWNALNSAHAAEMLGCVSTERIRDELERMLAHDTIASLNLFAKLKSSVIDAMFPDGLRLSATMKG